MLRYFLITVKRSVSMNEKITNPFSSAVELIISELFQLLIVVEGIKLDKTKHNQLKKLARLKKEIDDSPEVKEYVNSKNTSYLVENTELEFIKGICFALDQGWSAKRYDISNLKWVIKEQDNPSKRFPEQAKKRINILEIFLPDLLENNKFEFKGLAEVKNKYPHLQILLAYMHSEELIDNIIALQSFNTEFIKAQLLIKINLESKPSVFSSFEELAKKTNTSPYINHRKNQIVNLLYYDELSNKLNIIERLLDLGRQKHKKPLSINTTSKDETWRNSVYSTDSTEEVITLKIKKSEVIAELEDNNWNGILNSIVFNIEPILDPKVNKWPSIEAYNGVDMFLQYDYWAGFRTELLLMNLSTCGESKKTPSKSRRRLMSIILLERGLTFSHWLEKNRSDKNHITVKDALEQYCDEKNKSISTIKQSYEAVNRLAHGDTFTDFLDRQSKWVLENQLPNARFVFPSMLIHK